MVAEDAVPVHFTYPPALWVPGELVDDSYDLPFKFGGTIEKVTYKLGPEQISVAEREVKQRAVAAARDTPVP